MSTSTSQVYAFVTDSVSNNNNNNALLFSLSNLWVRFILTCIINTITSLILDRRVEQKIRFHILNETSLY